MNDLTELNLNNQEIIPFGVVNSRHGRYVREYVGWMPVAWMRGARGLSEIVGVAHVKCGFVEPLDHLCLKRLSFGLDDALEFDRVQRQRHFV